MAPQLTRRAKLERLHSGGKRKIAVPTGGAKAPLAFSAPPPRHFRSPRPCRPRPRRVRKHPRAAPRPPHRPLRAEPPPLPPPPRQPPRSQAPRLRRARAPSRPPGSDERGAISEKPRGHRPCYISGRSQVRVADRNTGSRSSDRFAWCPTRVWPPLAPSKFRQVGSTRHCHRGAALSKTKLKPDHPEIAPPSTGIWADGSTTAIAHPCSSTRHGPRLLTSIGNAPDRGKAPRAAWRQNPSSRR